MSASGWGSSYTPANYGSSLADQLTGAANYDPSQQQSTSNQTSAARTFGSQDGATTAASFLQPVAGSLQQGAAQAAGATTPMNWLQPFAGNLNANTPAPTPTQTAFNNVSMPSIAAAPAANAMQYSYSPMMKAGVAVNTAPTLQNTVYGYGGGFNGNTNMAGQSVANAQGATAYAGPQYVNSAGAIYKWDPATRSYTQVARSDGKGNLVGMTQSGVVYGPNGGYAQTTGAPAALSAADLAGAASAQSVGSANATMNAQQINSLFNQQIAAYGADVAKQQATTAAAQTAAADQGQQNFLYNALMNNGGQLPSNLTGYSPAAITAAQQQYAADQLTKFNPTMASVDTSAVDATNAASQASLNSMYASSGGGADGAYISRQGSGNAATLTGQAQLAHDSDYASKFDTNLTTFAQALSNQSTADVNVTGQRLNQDIQSVGDTVSQLQQQLSQLDQATQLKVGSALNQLQQQINQYRQAVAQYGQTSQQVVDLGRTILSGAASATAGLTAATAAA